ncbi:GNAT family N-acetyltransferase [Knoellia subterranea]|uniref:Acyltransferase n=1 Tax=Knoellia subterranea KCTC 19937 TaxID=1385521 RepID=A0A0A0JN95_9MICO|nr:GNAT family N-acetyltransferase [Knoellia subterranea]KGN38603.1 acyltransferase [Knoellia subterranea KCTC 19937]
MSLTIRERRPDDLPELVEVLSAQAPSSGYPHRWPLPFPVEEFIVRPGELGAWVAVAEGSIVGHVAATDVATNWMSATWSEVLGRPGSELGEVSILFVGLDQGGTGVGGALLDRAVAEIRALGREPVLDVVGEDTRAGRFYRRRGWTTVGHARPAWLPDGQPDVAFMVLPGRTAPDRK